MTQYAGTYQYGASGGTPPYNFFKVSGGFPPSLVLDSTGLVVNDMTVPGYYSWRMGVSDALGKLGYIDDNAYVMDMTGTFPIAHVGEAYDYSLAMVYGVGAGTWTLVGGTNLTGTGLMFSDGRVSGVPTTIGNHRLYVHVVDDNGIQTTRYFTLVIAAATGDDFGDLIRPAFDNGSYKVAKASSTHADALIEFVLYSGGTFLVRRIIGTLLGNKPFTGNYVGTPAVGVGAGYEVRAVGNSNNINNIDGSVITAIDTGWISLATDQVLLSQEADASSSIGEASSNVEIGTYTVSFRKVGETATIDTTINLTAEAFV